MNHQIVTVTFFRFSGFRNKYWAFGQMGLRHLQAGYANGLSFAKMLGVGAGNGFSIFPDFGRFVWLCAWDTEQQAEHFFQKDILFRTFKARSSELTTVFLHPLAAHGYWDKQQPFRPSDTQKAQHTPQKPIAVLTRATIRLGLLHRFWQYVPSVSKSMEGKKGLLLAAGIGELPLIQQATISLWASEEDMKNYAYENRHHAEVVKKTRQLGWYSEELFARFSPYKIVGDVAKYPNLLFLKDFEGKNSTFAANL